MAVGRERGYAETKLQKTGRDGGGGFTVVTPRERGRESGSGVPVCCRPKSVFIFLFLEVDLE